MKTISKLLAVALVGVLAFSGLAAATGNVGLYSGVSEKAGNSFGPAAAAGGDRPLEGSNSPWVGEDERLERFQERFDLTDEQVDEIQVAVEDAVDDGATREDIRATVMDMLEAYGVEAPTLGPPGDAERGYGQQRHGQGHGFGGPAHRENGTAAGSGPGNGPHGPANGSFQE